MVVVKKRDGTPISVRMSIKEFLQALTEYNQDDATNELMFDNGLERVYVDLSMDRFSYLNAEGDSVEITTDADYKDWYDGYNTGAGDGDWYDNDYTVPYGEKE